MIGSHSSLGGGHVGAGVGHGGDRIYIISDSSNLGGGQLRRPTTYSTASESLEMMTTASSSSYSHKGSRMNNPEVPRSYSDVIPEDLRVTGGGQLPGSIPEDSETFHSAGVAVIKQELATATSRSQSASSRTSVFSDYLPCGLTRFHFSLCFGIVGFVIFWLGLLLRIYLPTN